MYKKVLSVLVSLMLLSAILFSLTSYAAGPLAELYSYPSQGCNVAGGVPLNLNNMGYSTYSYTHTSPYYVRRTMDTDAIFYISTHGIDVRYQDGTHTYGGAVATYNSSGTKTGSVSANIDLNDSTNYSLEGKWGSNPGALGTIRLAYWSACYSAQTSSYYGNLLEKSTQLGALCSLGFIPSISITQSYYFDNSFFFWTTQPYTVWESAYRAVQSTRERYGGDAGGTDEWRIAYKPGITNYDIYLKPAKYGYAY